MKKKIALLVTFILAFVVSLAVFAGCGGGETVTVNGLSEAITLEVGKTRNLTATASDGSELVWASSDTSVATVSDKGKVEALKAGTTNVTATVKGGTASATCVVTVKDPVVFTFKNGGTVVTEITVDRDKEPVQLTVSASDGSTVTNWSSSDERRVSVSPTGLITGLKETEEGTPVIVTVKTSTGSGNIAVTVIDTAEHSAIVEGAGNAKVGEWWYRTNTNDNRNPEILTNELRKGIVTFEFGGNVNWNTGDVQLGRKKDSTAQTGWTAFSGKITSSVDGKIRIFDTIIDITAGENEFTVYYNQADNDNDVYITPTNSINGGKFEITVSDLKWEPYTVRELAVPSFTVSGDTVTITDDNEVNAEGVSVYKIGFYLNGEYVTAQEISGKTGTLDQGVLAENGTYTLKIMAAGISGFKDSEWSEQTVQYEVTNADAAYELEWTTQSTSRWTYYSVPEDSTGKADVASYEKGVVTFETAYLGWKFDSTQMKRNYPKFAAGATLKLDMKINSDQEGSLSVSGNLIELEVGDNEFTLFITQPANGATISILFGDPSKSGVESMSFSGAVKFTIQVVSIVEYAPDPLATPSATYTAKDGETPAKLEIIDNENDADDVSSYQVGFFDADGKLVGYTAITSDGTFSDLTIKKGTYTLKVRAIPKTGEFTNSEWSAAITSSYEVANAVTITPLPNGGEHDSYTNPDKWYEWHDQGWNGSTVTLGDAYTTDNGEIHFSYTIKGTNRYDQAAHLYYHYSDLTAGTAYTITLKINSTVACTIDVCGTKVDLKVGDNDVTVNFVHPEKHGDWEGKDIGATIRIYFNDNGSFVLSNVQVTELTQTKLTAPSIAIAADGTVTITNAPAAGVGSYLAGFYAEGADTPAATVTVVNGEKIDVSSVANGTYTVKIMAKAEDVAYTDSDWSAEGVEYTVSKTTNTMDILNVLPADVSAPESGWYYYATTDAADWNSWTSVNVSSAVYNIDTKVATFVYTATGNNKWSLQLIYKFPTDTTSVKLRIQTDFDCQIQAVRDHTEEEANQYDLTAGTPVEITFSGAGEAYIQIPVTSTVTGGTVTITIVD